MKIIDSPSPNQSDRPSGVKPDLLVIHGTAGTDRGDLQHLRSPASNVSYHYLVLRDGSVHRLVRPERRAWHAGVSSWEGRENVNNYGIGIGMSNRGDGELYTRSQYEAAGRLCAILRRVYGIPLERIVGHCHVSPGRKSDPWLTFEWMRLAAEIGRAA